jgi:hypothetical protein
MGMGFGCGSIQDLNVGLDWPESLMVTNNHKFLSSYWMVVVTSALVNDGFHAFDSEFQVETLSMLQHVDVIKAGLAKCSMEKSGFAGP